MTSYKINKHMSINTFRSPAWLDSVLKAIMYMLIGAAATALYINNLYV